jgi:hypothetical protein
MTSMSVVSPAHRATHANVRPHTHGSRVGEGGVDLSPACFAGAELDAPDLCKAAAAEREGRHEQRRRQAEAARTSLGLGPTHRSASSSRSQNSSTPVP